MLATFFTTQLTGSKPFKKVNSNTVNTQLANKSLSERRYRRKLQQLNQINKGDS